MTNFSIKDVEALTGIKPHTLRIWEQRYGIPLPNRTATNIRYYTDTDLKLLLNVAMLNRQGYKISKITKMSKEEVDKLVLEITLESDDYTVHIESLIKAMFDLDELAFNQVLHNNISQIGFRETFCQIVFPLLSRIGILWQTSTVNPAYEHFISHLVRQKLFVAIDSLPKISANQTTKFLLFLPAQETHDIGLLFANYLIRSFGYHTNYLGPNLPMNELSSIAKLYPPDYILTVLTSSVSNQTPLQVANKLHGDFPDARILLAGSQIIDNHIHYPPKVSLLSSMKDLMSFLETLNKTLAH